MSEDNDIESSRAPLMEHLVELRQRLITMIAALLIGFLVCFFFSKDILKVLIHPFVMAQALVATQKASAGHFDMLLILVGLKSMPTAAATGMVYTAPLEVFFTQVKLAGFGGLVVTFPVIAWQIYRFVAPGLYKRERMAFLPFLLASPILFALGAALVYFIMLPFVLWFGLSQQITGVGAGAVSVQMLPKISEYLDLVTALLLAFGLCFQLPVVLSLLGMAGIVSSQMLRSGRRYAIVGVAGLAAVVTPPDPFSMLSLVVPLVLLYEISIWCVKLIELRRGKEEAAEDAS